MRFLPLLALLAACPSSDVPDDSCFAEGPTPLAITLEADRDDIETSELTIVVSDCLDSSESGTGAVGDTVTIEGPSSGELVVEVSGEWSIGGGDTAGEGGTCTGRYEVSHEEVEAGAVTVALTCATEWELDA